MNRYIAPSDRRLPELGPTYYVLFDATLEMWLSREEIFWPVSKPRSVPTTKLKGLLTVCVTDAVIAGSIDFRFAENYTGWKCLRSWAP
ncbi:hypothetical protein [Burkholderia cenocepacia]|uniref:Uncharacterized protein n=1 Tax=Burkholderia cenocepacia TaxID=95486 RepID=A0A3S9NDQ0_9BURK|nr:hypothetical protein [Burkholderia cenocepacia]AZQ53780.1 hypothetical protein D5R55_23035 [Burkholderia cenocepacia]